MKDNLIGLAETPRGENGRFIAKGCPDLNCGGQLVAGTDRFNRPVWHCDGLTYDRDDGPLRACEVEFEMPTALRVSHQEQPNEGAKHVRN